MAKFNWLVRSNTGKILGFCGSVVPLALLACSSSPGDGGSSNGGNGGSVSNAGSGMGGSAGGTNHGGTAGGGTGNNGGTGGTGNGGGGTGGVVNNGGGGSGGETGGVGGTGNGGGGTGGTSTGGCANLPGVLGHPDCTATYPTVPGFTLALVEEFNAPIDVVNDPIWTYSDGNPDGPVRFVKDNISFADGYMYLTLTHDPVAGSKSYAEQMTLGNKDYSSGELRTKYNNFRYGRYEAHFKAPSVKPNDTVTNGGYVATLFTFRTPKFTEWREIDLEKTGDSPNTMATNLINGDGHQAWGPDFADTGNSPVTIGFNAREDFHTYAFEWTSAGITWYVDTQMIRQQTGTQKLAIPTESAKIMMNLWWGSFGGDGTNNQYPADITDTSSMTTTYDWFRFYKWDMEDTYPCSPTPTCLPQTDLDGSKNNPEDGVQDIAPNAGN